MRQLSWPAEGGVLDLVWVRICGLKLYRVFCSFFFVCEHGPENKKGVSSSHPNSVCTVATTHPGEGQRHPPGCCVPISNCHRTHPRPLGRGWRPRSWGSGRLIHLAGEGHGQRSALPNAPGGLGPPRLLTHSKYRGCKHLASLRMPPFYKSPESKTRTLVQKRCPTAPTRSPARGKKSSERPRNIFEHERTLLLKRVKIHVTHVVLQTKSPPSKASCPKVTSKAAQSPLLPRCSLPGTACATAA